MTFRRATFVAGALLAGLIACKGLSSDGPVAIEFVQPPDSILVGQTLTLHIRALDRSGDSTAATIYLVALNPDTLATDSVALSITGVATNATKNAHGRVVARAGNLRSEPLSIKVTAP